MSDTISTYHLEQQFKYEGDDWWSWSIWVEGSDQDLDKVKHVVYTLHSTFRNPVRTITSRKTKFKLESEGWGVFTIYATVTLKNGKDVYLQHELYLEYEDGKRNLN